MAKIALLLENAYQDLEVWYPTLRLRETGHEVVFVAPQAGETYMGKYGYPAVSDLAIADTKIDDFDAVIIPGGFAPDYMRRVPAMVEFVRDMWNADKVVAAICHGGWMLASAEIIEDKKLTSFFAIKDDLVHAGATWVDEETMVDGKLITARKPEDLPAFCKAILEAL